MLRFENVQHRQSAEHYLNNCDMPEEVDAILDGLEELDRVMTPDKVIDKDEWQRASTALRNAQDLGENYFDDMYIRDAFDMQIEIAKRLGRSK